MPSTSQRDIRSAYQTDDGSRRCHRSTQSSRPDGMGAPHEQHPKPRQRNRQFRTDLQLSRTRSSDCRLRPELRVRFRAKSCSIGLTSNGFAPANPTHREIPVPLILSFTCVKSPQESHNPRSDAACVHTADNTQSLRGQRLRGKHQQTHRQKRSCDGLKMPYTP